MEVVIDANGASLGRVASYAAKQALLGKKVAIVNCKEAVISGNLQSNIEEYTEKIQRGGSSQKGPFFPKTPERIMKRTIRGMLSYKKGRGRKALESIKCYNETPLEYEGTKKIISGKEKSIKATKLKDICKEFGWKE